MIGYCYDNIVYLPHLLGTLFYNFQCPTTILSGAQKLRHVIVVRSHMHQNNKASNADLRLKL